MNVNLEEMIKKAKAKGMTLALQKDERASAICEESLKAFLGNVDADDQLHMTEKDWRDLAAAFKNGGDVDSATALRLRFYLRVQSSYSLAPLFSESSYYAEAEASIQDEIEYLSKALTAAANAANAS